MNLKAVGYRLLLQMDKIEEVSKGGIVIARHDGGIRDQAGVEIGVVLDIGPEAYKDTGSGEPWVKIGDKIQVVRYSGVNVEHVYRETGIMYRWVNDRDVLGIIEDVE